MHDTLADIPSAEVEPRAGRREWIGLAALALPSLLVSIDIFVMLLALPHLSVALRADSTQQLWIMDVYGFMLSGFLITMGTLGDRIGRRKLLLLGASAFGVASVLAAFSTSPEMLIAARAVQGIAGATLAPSTLALISTMFRDPKQRALAIGVWLVCFMGGAVIGPLAGGALLEHFWWGSVFLLGVPAMVLLLVLGPLLLPESRNATAGKLDLLSVSLSLATILPIIYGLKELAKNGWEPLPIAAIMAGVAVGAVFVRRQHALSEPLLDLRLFASRAFSTALGSMLLTTGLTGAIMVFVTQHLQLVEGLSPLGAGLAMLPAVAASIISFQSAPLLARRVHTAYLIAGGLMVTVIGLLVLTQVNGTSGIVALVTGFALSNLGVGPLVTLGTNLIIGSAPTEKAGAAAALSQTSNEFGFALGVAIIGSLGNAVYRSQIASAIPSRVPVAAAQAARENLTSATDAAHHLPDSLAVALLTPARAAFTSGMHVAAALSAIILIGVAILIMTQLRNVGIDGASKVSETVSAPVDVASADHKPIEASMPA